MARDVTREESYRDGWHEGRRRAEKDLSDGGPVGSFSAELREWASRDGNRAWNLGVARGYRDTVARFEAGEISWETFDHMPLGREY